MNGLICPFCSGDSFNHLHSSYKSEIFECKKCHFMCEFLNSKLICFYFAYENAVYYTTMKPDSNLELGIIKVDNDGMASAYNIFEANDLHTVAKFQYKSIISFADIKELYNISISYIKNMIFK